VFEALRRPVPANGQLLVEIRRLGEKREHNEKTRSRHTQLSETLEDNERLAREREGRIRDHETDLAALLEEAGCRDGEELRSRGAAYARRIELEEQIETHGSAIRRATDAEQLGEVEPELERTSHDELVALKAALRSQIDTCDKDLGALRERRGQADQERSSLHSEDRVSALRAREESLREEIDQRAREWARHAVAEHLLDVAKERHAQANQPKVIREAGSYFELFTGGRYQRVFAPPGESSIQVIDAQERSKEASDLSRGSAEQLYLAIRFGYIAAQAAGTEPLPVLMDDVLVNFDPARARAAAQAIVGLSHKRQVLFFTCHPTMVETFRAVEPGVPLYRIADNELVADRS
jgi:uncharacterized protein YhaN